MLKRILLFGNPYHLSSKNEQLLIFNKEDKSEKTTPAEDLGVVVLDHYSITLTHGVVQLLNEHNVAMVFCNKKHMPISLLLPLEHHYIQNKRFQLQINASVPLKKDLWKQVVRQKIANQATLLSELGIESAKLKRLCKEVKSGDSMNLEAQAARHYWPHLFGDKEFSRERFGKPPNLFLNYGYAILRATVARSLVAAGLLPTLGIHHRNKYNAYCLADDMMEPYRPYVDKLVSMEYDNGIMLGTQLTKDHKSSLLGVMFQDVMIKKQTSPLMVAVQFTCNSLVKCLERKTKNLDLPVMDG